MKKTELKKPNEERKKAPWHIWLSYIGMAIQYLKGCRRMMNEETVSWVNWVFLMVISMGLTLLGVLIPVELLSLVYENELVTNQTILIVSNLGMVLMMYLLGVLGAWFLHRWIEKYL